MIWLIMQYACSSTWKQKTLLHLQILIYFPTKNLFSVWNDHENGFLFLHFSKFIRGLRLWSRFHFIFVLKSWMLSIRNFSLCILLAFPYFNFMRGEVVNVVNLDLPQRKYIYFGHPPYILSSSAWGNATSHVQTI